MEIFKNIVSITASIVMLIAGVALCGGLVAGVMYGTSWLEQATGEDFFAVTPAIVYFGAVIGIIIYVRKQLKITKKEVILYK